MTRRGRLVADLLGWYRRSRRDLPWRRSRDPYRIWVAEVMLQQTRVEAARPYFERFVRDFPSLGALASAPLDAVLARWSGLGYYDRARALHRAVRECRERFGGRVPRDPDLFGSLPGVGPYTRAAVGSIAFGAPLAVVDGNVVRVLARLFDLPGHARDRRLLGRVGELAQELLPPEAPGDFNQALMELGATLCTPRAPRCPDCPLRRGCRARASGRVEAVPAAAPRPRPRKVRWEALLVERRGRVLLIRRGERGRWKGMWELPGGPGSAARAAAGRGLRIEKGEEIARLRHSVLDERIELRLHRGRLLERPPAGSGARWVGWGELGERALSSLWRKALAAARGAGAQRSQARDAQPSRCRLRATSR